jgi:hypothetical protein
MAARPSVSPGADRADKGRGLSRLSMFVWNPGDGSDVVDGGAGTDTLQFNGANIAEKIDITANGSDAARYNTSSRSKPF